MHFNPNQVHPSTSAGVSYKQNNYQYDLQQFAHHGQPVQVGHLQQSVPANTKVFPVRMLSRLAPAVTTQHPSSSVYRPVKLEDSTPPILEAEYGTTQRFSPDADYPDYDQVDTRFGQGFGGGKMTRGRGRGQDSSKSLRFFSHRVCDKVKQKRHTTYNEVADELVQEYFVNTPPQNADKQQHDVKNIRRRVYDALNVLIALNIVSKEKKTISWVGVSNPLVEDEEKELQLYAHQKEEEISTKEMKVRQLLGELVGFKSLVDKNREEERKYGRPPEESVIYMPFALFTTDKRTFINCNISHDKSEILCQFSGEYEVVTDQQVLQRLGHTYGVETGVVDACNLGRVRSLVPPGLRHYLPNLPVQQPPQQTQQQVQQQPHIVHRQQHNQQRLQPDGHQMQQQQYNYGYSEY